MLTWAAIYDIFCSTMTFSISFRRFNCLNLNVWLNIFSKESFKIMQLPFKNFT